MANVSYTRINWQDAPSTATPINQSNLNKMDKGIYDCAQQINQINSDLTDLESKLDIANGIEFVTRIVTTSAVGNIGTGLNANEFVLFSASAPSPLVKPYPFVDSGYWFIHTETPNENININYLQLKL